MLNGMSDDGRGFAGMTDWAIGYRFPTVWVDGKQIRLYEEGIDDSEGYLYEGLCYCVSPNGKYT